MSANCSPNKQATRSSSNLGHIVVDRTGEIEADARAISQLSARVPVLAFVNRQPWHGLHPLRCDAPGRTSWTGVGFWESYLRRRAGCHPGGGEDRAIPHRKQGHGGVQLYHKSAVWAHLLA